MWIKSQDGSLYDCQGIFKTNNKFFSSPEDIWYINGIVNSNYEPMLGKYNSEERVIEILNDIQLRICNFETSKMIGNNSSLNISEINVDYCVYQMPKE